jgi:hypothetical protein
MLQWAIAAASQPASSQAPRVHANANANAVLCCRLRGVRRTRLHGTMAHGMSPASPVTVASLSHRHPGPTLPAFMRHSAGPFPPVSPPTRRLRVARHCLEHV